MLAFAWVDMYSSTSEASAACLRLEQVQIRRKRNTRGSADDKEKKTAC